MKILALVFVLMGSSAMACDWDQLRMDGVAQVNDQAQSSGSKEFWIETIDLKIQNAYPFFFVNNAGSAIMGNLYFDLANCNASIGYIGSVDKEQVH